MNRRLGAVLKKWLLTGAMALAGVLSACAEGDGMEVIWWQVGDWEDTTETGDSLGSVLVDLCNGGGFTTAKDLGVGSARIREVNSGDYLKILEIDEYGNIHDFSLDSMNVPMRWVADVSGFASGSAESAFVIELGNYESGTWSMLAVSESASYVDLRGSGHIVNASETYEPMYATPWAPTTYFVPEPNSALLTLVGCALLALRRKRRRSHG